MSFSDPNLALLSIFTGAAGVYLEFTRPGTVFAGVIGFVLFLLGIHRLSAFPIDWRGVSLLACSVLFFIAEAKSDSHGIWTAAGAVAMLIGNMMLIHGGKGAPRIQPAVAIGVAVVFAPLSGFLFTLAERARTNKRAVPKAASRYPERSSQHF